MTIRLHLTSVFVDDQDEALRFYTEVLGFEPRTDEPIGDDHRWLTVGAKGQDVELLLEPSCHPAVAPYREALEGSNRRSIDAGKRGAPIVQVVEDSASSTR